MTSKRLDLQGIRGLAILSVLGFHFYPRFFPNGYLGVDQFFVLSGFLMCMLLTKAENMPVFSLLIHFYSRRFKRILPLYFLIILITVIALYTVFPDTALLQNETSAMKALFFVSNRPHTGEEDYFEKLSIAMDLFTHTWSLSVEIQFYFIVPFIFIIGNCFRGNYKNTFYVIVGLVSFIVYLALPLDVAFNSLFARIWQFVIGMLTYLHAIEHAVTKTSKSYNLLKTVEQDESERLSLMEEGGDGLSDVDDEEEEAGEVVKNPVSDRSISLGSFSKYTFLIPMCFTVTYPIPILPSIVRPLFTVFTGILMLLSIEDEFLSNKVLTYIGDISYSLYLIHWPIYAYSKITFEENPYAITGALVLSVLLAVAVFETYEKWYLKLSTIFCALLITILLISNVMLINKDALEDAQFLKEINGSLSSTHEFERLDGVLPNMTFDDATRLNKYWNKFDINVMKEPGCVRRTPKHSRWCDFEGAGDEFKIAAFGNSYTLNHHKMLIQECKNRAYNITMDSERGCEPLAATPSDHACVNKLDEFVQFIESAKPDYAFMFTRFFAVADPFTTNATDLEHDRTYLEMRSQLTQFLPNIKKKLFILDSFPRANSGYIARVANDLKNGKSREEVSKNLLRPSGFERGRIRHAALVKECGEKCELIDYLPLFWNNSSKMYQYMDYRGFSYFTSPNHLSAHGIELVRPIYTKICANLS